MSREDELRDNLKLTAKELYAYDRNPISWSSWITFLLKELENLSMDVNPMHQDIYEDLLSMVEDLIRERRRTGGW